MTALAAAVLPLIRTRDEVWRWGVANAHGRDMHEAVDILERAVRTEDPATVLAVTHKAIASAISVITRADDSSGIIGDACRRLLDLHPVVAARAGMPAAELVGWMIDFQFHGKVDYFTIDPVAYAPALGSAGLAKYRARLDEIRAGLGPQPSTAANLRAAAGKNWPDLQPHVMERLSTSPYDAVLFALLTLHDVEQAWTLAHELGLSDRDTWTRLVKEYQKLDPLAVLPVLADLVDGDLVKADAGNYQIAARRLKTMRKLAAGTEKADEVDELVAALREEHRRRPRLQQEFDRAGLP